MAAMEELVGRYSKLAPVPKPGQSITGRPVPDAPRVYSVQKRLGPDLIAQLVADYVAGAPSTELVTKYNLGKGTVLRLLRSNGVIPRNQPMTADHQAEAIQLYQAGWSLAQIGQKFGREHTVIRDVLKWAGWSGATATSVCGNETPQMTAGLRPDATVERLIWVAGRLSLAAAQRYEL